MMPGRLGRIEPGRRERDVHGPGDLAFGRGRGRRRVAHEQQSAEQERYSGPGEDASERHGHASFDDEGSRSNGCRDYARVGPTVNRCVAD